MPYTYDEFLSKSCHPLAIHGLKALPAHMLKQYFPKLYQHDYNRFYYDLPEFCGKIEHKHMPFPSRVNHKEAIGRGFDLFRLLMTQRENDLLIESLNSAGYRSPYVL